MRISATLLVFFILFSFSSCKKQLCKKNSTGKIYVTNEGSGTISVIDAERLEVIRTITLKDKDDKKFMGHNIQVSPDKKSVWITCMPEAHHGEEFLYVLKGKKEKITERISIGTHLHLAHVVMNEASTFAYATGYDSDEVIEVDMQKLEVSRRFPLAAGSGPHGLRYMDGKLYIACMDSYELQILDTQSGSIERIFLGGISVQTAVVPFLNMVYTTLYDLKQIIGYNTLNKDTVLIKLPDGSQGPIQIYPAPDNKYLYVCDQGSVNNQPVSNKVYIIDMVQAKVIKSITCGQGPHGVTVSNDGKRAFVSNMLDNSVSIIDTESQTLVKTVAVGERPNGISYLDCCDCEN